MSACTDQFRLYLRTGQVPARFLELIKRRTVAKYGETNWMGYGSLKGDKELGIGYLPLTASRRSCPWSATSA